MTMTHGLYGILTRCVPPKWLFPSGVVALNCKIYKAPPRFRPWATQLATEMKMHHSKGEITFHNAIKSIRKGGESSLLHY